ncbi:MAG: trypsin-like peptidase domain-containing protein [Nitrososphaerales archaeon]|jgi:S1-C subfamily serine protease
MNLRKLIQSNDVSGSRSSSGIILTTKAVVGIIVVIALLLAASFIVFAPSIGAAADSTFTKTVTQTQVLTSVANLGNSTTQGLNPEAIYSYANQSIVTLQGVQTTTASTIFGPQTSEETVLGSGFVIYYSNQYYVVTNYHVAGATSNLTLTFSDGNSYPAKVVGSDPYSDLAVVTVSSAPISEFHPLTLVSSSTLQVGQYILAIGNPYGLSGTETFGIISQLGETIQDETAGNFSIADVIQFSAPINPGNSGGALLNANGEVVGITTATVSGSQGIGFAIPSDTIIRELDSLITTGSYAKHSYLGIGEVDMNYQLAQATGANVTYGALIETIVPGGPATTAGLQGGSKTVTIEGNQYLIGGDIIVGINGTKIINENALASYLEEHTVAGQKVNLEIIRSGHYMSVLLTLGSRPPVA